jgi:hypothetical protein
MDHTTGAKCKVIGNGLSPKEAWVPCVLHMHKFTTALRLIWPRPREVIGLRRCSWEVGKEEEHEEGSRRRRKRVKRRRRGMGWFSIK